MKATNQTAPRANQPTRPSLTPKFSPSEKVIEDFFTHHPPRAKFLVEFGAGDTAPLSYAPQFVERQGWTGLRVEPPTQKPGPIQASDRTPSLRCVQASVTRQPLHALLHEQNVQDVDLLSIHLSADNLAVLQGWDFERWQPSMIVVTSGRERAVLLRELARRGYSLWLDDGQALFFARVQGRATQVPTRNFAGTGSLQPYAEIQREVEEHLHDYLGRKAAEIERIVVVGGHLGYEVEAFLKHYPKAEIHIFEPSRRYFQPLATRFAGQLRVRCHPLAVAEQNGTAVFHEGSLDGVGSLLPLKTVADAETWIPDGFRPAEEYTVPVTALDRFAPLANQPIDLLWCDAQGAELSVLRGARKTLAHCRALFLEVATTKLSYEGQCRLHELEAHLAEHGFYLAGIGLCHSGNGTGNSLWLRRAAPGARREAEARTVVEAAEAARKVHPYLLQLNYLPLDREIVAANVAPLDLFSPQRFDLPAKLLYARHRAWGVRSGFATDLYREHIRVITRGRCCEDDGSKANLADYQASFDRLLDAIQLGGFDDAQGCVPVARRHLIIDGAHRVAACLWHQRAVSALFFDRDGNDYSAAWFQARGLGEKWADAIALEYCRVKPGLHLVTVFPSALGQDDEIRSILSGLGTIVYAKAVRLSRRGALGLIRELYAGEPWLGDAANGFAGAAGKMRPCFQHDGPVRVFLFETDDLAKTKAAKARIRELFRIEHHSAHINDSAAETLRLAQLFFNEHSLHFLNHARPRPFDRFDRHLALYRQWLSERGPDAEQCCVDGSAVLAAYGLRDAQDLDFLHLGGDDLPTGYPDVNSHNAEAHHHAIPRDDIIFDPAHHFYFGGLKFAALHVIRQLKVRRNEAKDRRDVAAIDRMLGAASSPAAAPPRAAGRGRVSLDVVPLEPARTPAPQGERAPALARPVAKLVGLVPARNEGARLAFCLRALARYADAIVYLDDCSDDDTPDLVQALARECRVERILRKRQWHRSEPADRNALLRAGREIGGTHFLVLDADEAFTANCADGEFLRRRILALQRGEQLALAWIQLWRSVRQYRCDDSVWTNNYKAVVFCDDGRCQYRSEFIHTPRVPADLPGAVHRLSGYEHGLLHFQFVNWRNLLVKQAWYRCLERVRDPRKLAHAINQRYAPSKDEGNLGLQPAPREWFDGYGFFDPTVLDAPDRWREAQVLAWFDQFGRDHFRDLDIWDVDWGAAPSTIGISKEPEPVRSPAFKLPEAPPQAKACAANPNPPRPLVDSLLALAQRNFDAGNLAAARDYLERAADVAPEDARILTALAHTHAQLGAWAEAVSVQDQAARLQPYDPLPQVLLAALCVRCERIDQFEAAVARALELQPDFPPALRLLADLNLREQRFPDAAKLYYRLLRHSPDDVELLLPLGVCFFKSGEREAAREVFERVLALDPNHALARENLEAVAQSEPGARSPAPALVASVPVRGAPAVVRPTAPLVSAIVSTYNSERFIRGCLEDLEAQTLRDRLEIIVVDSASPQHEGAIVEEFQQRYGNIISLRTEQREWIYAAWNRGLRAARGRFVTNANTDDRHHPAALERLARYLLKHPEAGLVYADSLVTRDENAPWSQARAKGVFRWPEHDRRLLFDVCYLGPHPMWRRDLHESHGYFDVSYRSAGDYEFWLRLSEAGVRMQHLPETLGLYLENPVSISLGDPNLNWQESERARHRHWPAAWGKRPPTRWRSFEVPLTTSVADEAASSSSVASNPEPSAAAVAPTRSAISLAEGRGPSKRVLLACDFFWPSVGGVEAYVEDLGVRLLAAGHRVEVACRALPTRVANEHRGLRIHSFDSARMLAPGGPTQEMQAFQRRLGSGDYDVVIALTQPDNWVGVGLATLPKPRPRLILLPSINAQNVAEWERDHFRSTVETILRAADLVVAVSESGHDAQFFRQAQIPFYFLPHAVESSSAPGSFRESFGFRADLPLLVMVANFWPVKNHLGLLKALASARGEWQLALIGHPQPHLAAHFERVRAQAARDARVRLIAGLPRDQAAAAIREADLLLVPSKGESAGPLVVLQAMSFGTPWLATPECNAVADEAGGWIAPLGEFPQVIQELLAQRDARVELGRLGRAHWEQCFTWEQTLPAWAALLKGDTQPPDLRMPSTLREANQRVRARLAAPSRAKAKMGAAAADRSPLLSVIIPTHNRAAVLRECLQALARQSLPPAQFEVCVCDDGSTDDTTQIVSTFAAPYRLNYLRQENRGPASARNLGLRQARGSWLVFLNDDAWLDPEALARHLEAHQAHPHDRIAVLGRFSFRPDYTRRVFGALLEDTDVLFGYPQMTDGTRYDFNRFYTCNISVSRQAVLDVGLFDEDFTGPAAEDLELGYRLWQRGYSVLYQARILAWHDHAITPRDFCRVHQVRARGAVTLMVKHPELPFYTGLNSRAVEQLRAQARAQAQELETLIRTLEQQDVPLSEADRPQLRQRFEPCLKLVRRLQARSERDGVLQSPWLERLLAIRDGRRLTRSAARTSPRVSVVMPCYNYARYLPEAVQSVVAQEFDDWELIIVNDGSTDDSGKVAEELARHEARRRIRVIHQANCGQPAISRNRGIQAAQGAYLLPLDADDQIAPSFLKKAVAVLEEAPEVGVVYSHLQHIGERRDVFPSGEFRAAALAQQNGVPYCALYRREVWESVAGYRLNVRGYEDWDFWLGACERGWQGRLIAEPLFLYRKHGQGLLATANLQQATLRAQIVLNHPKLYGPRVLATARQTLQQSRPDASATPAAARPLLRVTYLISNIQGVTGGNLTLLRQANALAERGHRVTIVTYSDAPRWFDLKARVVKVPARQPLAAFVPASEVVISTYFTNTAELLAVNAPAKVYFAQGDQYVFEDETLSGRETNGPAQQLRQLSRVSYQRPDIRFVANSHNLARAVQRRHGRKADAILPVCTDQDIFRPSPQRRTGPPWRILVVGPDSRGSAIEPLTFKGLGDTRAALEQLRACRQDIEVVRISNTPPDVFKGFPCEFHQAPDDAAKTELFGAAHVLIYASHYDSCPRPPMEAMAAGAAVVCTATDGAKEYCVDGENCLLVPIQSPAAIADAVQRLLDDEPLRQRLIAGGRATAAQYPREREWDELEALLHRFVAEAAGKPDKSAAPIAAARDGHSSDKPNNKAVRLELPLTAKLGHVAPARALLGQKKHLEAWKATVETIHLRPYHPEAFLLLAEIAQGAGDFTRARHCATHARDLAPAWKPARQFLKKLPAQKTKPRVQLPEEAILEFDIPAEPRLTVCLITKNEEKFLASCLASVRPLAHQIVVVDTGSTDRTVELAREAGAEVYAVAWCDDFSAARNAALEHARGDWVLCLDADEELTPEGRATLAAELRDAKVLAYRLPIVHVGHEDEGCNYVPRLYRNAPGLFYVGRVHEQVFSSLEVRRQEWGLENRLGQSRLLHHGYTAEVMAERAKAVRNLRLLERAVADLPGDPNLLMNYGLELARAGRLSEGVERYREAFDALSALPPEQRVPELREALLTQYSSQLLKTPDPEGVVEVLRSRLAQAGGLTASLHFTLGLALIEQRRFSEAAEQMRECLAKRQQRALVPIHKDLHRGGPSHCLALCAQKLGQTDAAEAAFRQALEENPRARAIRIGYANFLAEQGQPVAALHQLHGVIQDQPEAAAAWIRGGQIALSRPEFLEVARDWTAEALQHCPIDATLRAQRVEALLKSQQVEEALEVARTTAAPMDAKLAAARALCELASGRALTAPASNTTDVNQEFLNWYRSLLEAGAESVVTRVNERLPVLRQRLPLAAQRIAAALREAQGEVAA